MKEYMSNLSWDTTNIDINFPYIIDSGLNISIIYKRDSIRIEYNFIGLDKKILVSMYRSNSEDPLSVFGNIFTLDTFMEKFIDNQTIFSKGILWNRDNISVHTDSSLMDHLNQDKFVINREIEHLNYIKATSQDVKCKIVSNYDSSFNKKLSNNSRLNSQLKIQMLLNSLI